MTTQPETAADIEAELKALEHKPLPPRELAMRARHLRRQSCPGAANTRAARTAKRRAAKQARKRNRR